MLPLAFSSVVLALVICLFSSTSVQASSEVLSKRDAFADSQLSSASWIWFSGPDLTETAPTGSVAFIKTFSTPVGKAAQSTTIAITTDNNFMLWVNGQPIGRGNDQWQTAQALSAALNASENVFSVLGVNDANTPAGSANPAGLLAAIRIFYTDGSNDTVLSDDSWLAATNIPAGFPIPADVSSFQNAQVVVNYGSGAWGTSVTLQTPDLSIQNLTGSNWIWTNANASTNTDQGTIGFRKTVSSPSGKKASSVTVLAAVDNTFSLYVNGQYIASPPFDDNSGNSISSWEFAQRITLNLTSPTTNVFDVLATNFPPQAGSTSTPAGFLGALFVEYTDGTVDTIRTDASWLISPTTVSSAAEFINTADSALKPAVSLGSLGMQPWGTLLGVVDALDVQLIPGSGSSSSSGSSGSGSSTSGMPGLQAPTSVLPSNSTASPTVGTAGAMTPYGDAAGVLRTFFLVGMSVALPLFLL